MPDYTDDQNQPDPTFDFAQRLRKAIKNLKSDMTTSQGGYVAPSPDESSIANPEVLAQLFSRADQADQAKKQMRPNTPPAHLAGNSPETTTPPTTGEWADSGFESGYPWKARSDSGSTPTPTPAPSTAPTGTTPPAPTGFFDPFRDVQKRLSELQPPADPALTPPPAGPGKNQNLASMGAMLGLILSGNAGEVGPFMRGQQDVQNVELNRWKEQNSFLLQQAQLAREKYRDELQRAVDEGRLSVESAQYQLKMKDDAYSRLSTQLAYSYANITDPKAQESAAAAIKREADSLGLSWSLVRTYAQAAALKLKSEMRTPRTLDNGQTVPMTDREYSDYKKHQAEQSGKGVDIGGHHYASITEVRNAWAAGIISNDDLRNYTGRTDWNPPQDWLDYRSHTGAVPRPRPGAGGAGQGTRYNVGGRPYTLSQVNTAYNSGILTLDEIHRTPGLENWKPGHGGTHPTKPTQTFLTNSLKNLSVDFSAGHTPAPSDFSQYVSAARAYGMNDASITDAIVRAALQSKHYRRGTLNGRVVLVGEDNTVYDALTGQRLN